MTFLVLKKKGAIDAIINWSAVESIDWDTVDKAYEIWLRGEGGKITTGEITVWGDEAPQLERCIRDLKSA